MKVKKTINHLLISGALVALLFSHTSAIRAEPDNEENTHLVIGDNNGTGISPEDLERLYEWLKELFEDQDQGSHDDEDLEDEGDFEDDEDF